MRRSMRRTRRVAAALLLGASTAAAQRAAKAPARQAAAAPATNPLLAPDVREVLRPAPDSFAVAMETTRGLFVVTVSRKWAPRGADRLYYLVKHGFYDDARFFRVLTGFMAQFGMHGDTAVTALWRELPLLDDPVARSNVRGAVTFATGGPNTRTTQLFVNLVDNAWLDGRGFAPVGQVTAGMEVVDSLHAGYGEGAPQGRGPDQRRIQAEGKAYLTRDFPKLDAIRRARVIWESKQP